MPTFIVVLLGNSFIPGAIVKAEMKIVARNIDEAERIATQYATAMQINGSRLKVDSVYECADTIRRTN